MEPPEPAGGAPDAADAARDDLQIRIADLDDAVEVLHRTVYRQQLQIDRLAQAVAALRAQLQSAQPPGAGDPREDVPPHY